jgi:hypothetical protein
MDPLILFIGELIADANLVLKIFALLGIASFFLQNLGKTPLAIILIVGVSYFVLFDLWVVFGSIYVLWMMIMLGFTNLVVDFFFVGAFSGNKGGGGASPISSGNDMARRQQAMQAAQQQASARAAGQFRGR